MKNKDLRRQGFTLIEMLVVISIIGILASLILPAVSKAMRTTQLTKASLYASEIQKAALSASLEATTNGNFTVAFPADMTTPPADMVTYANLLKQNGYLTDFRIYAVDNVPPASGTMTPAHMSFSLGMVSSSSPDNVPFATTKNFNPSGGGSLAGYVPQSPSGGGGSPSPSAPATTPAPTSTQEPVVTPDQNTASSPGASGVSSGGAPAAKPFGNTGFVVVHKGGDAQIFKPTDVNAPQGDPGTYIWGLDPSKASPPIGWSQTGQ